MIVAIDAIDAMIIPIDVVVNGGIVVVFIIFIVDNFNAIAVAVAAVVVNITIAISR